MLLCKKYNKEIQGRIIKIDEDALKNASATYIPACFALFFLDKDERGYYPWFRQDQIIRKLEDDEIPDEWKFIDDTNKYNL